MQSLSLNPVRRAWAWFDGLGDFQTTGILIVVLFGMLSAAVGLFVGSRMLLPAPAQQPAALAAPARIPAALAAQGRVPAAVALQPDRAESAPSRAVTLPSLVNLRAEPTTAARTLASLPRNTELELLGEAIYAGDTIWQHVRTTDGREGWVIATALD